MKTTHKLPMWILAGAATFGLLAGCASQPQAERPAARQRSHGSSEAAAASAADATSSAATSASASDRSGSVPVVLAAAAAPQEGAGDATAGKETFEQCAICHNVDSDEAKMGPSLKGLFKKEKLQSGKAATEQNILAVIKEGGNGMPGYEDLLEADEMKNLIAYLRTI